MSQSKSIRRLAVVALVAGATGAGAVYMVRRHDLATLAEFRGLVETPAALRVERRLAEERAANLELHCNAACSRVWLEIIGLDGWRIQLPGGPPFRLLARVNALEIAAPMDGYQDRWNPGGSEPIHHFPRKFLLEPTPRYHLSFTCILSSENGRVEERFDGPLEELEPATGSASDVRVYDAGPCAIGYRLFTDDKNCGCDER